ncbi:hypothetical protein [uncultured Leifsonia sp.]|uniref:hypothetical protein n=1 Tax=uncultured Leifsonia sp. TaxID=340359 RepID=UPI0025CEBFF6|nr:hypothetical protein [uncultured Leifsonia sp.]
MFILTVAMVVITTSVAIAIVILGLRSPKLSSYESPPRDGVAARVAVPAAPDRGEQAAGDQPV